jgi:hypothetical protein
MNAKFAVLLIAWFATFSTVQASDVPFFRRIDLTSPDEYSYSFSIKQRRVYKVQLRVKFRNASERDHARGLAGTYFGTCSYDNSCGAKTFFHIRIGRKDNGNVEDIISTYREVRGRIGFTQDAFIRELVSVPLAPGSYEIVVQPTDKHEQFRGTVTEVGVSYDPRALPSQE